MKRICVARVLRGTSISQTQTILSGFALLVHQTIHFIVTSTSLIKSKLVCPSCHCHKKVLGLVIGSSQSRENDRVRERKRLRAGALLRIILPSLHGLWNKGRPTKRERQSVEIVDRVLRELRLPSGRLVRFAKIVHNLQREIGGLSSSPPKNRGKTTA